MFLHVGYVKGSDLPIRPSKKNKLSILTDRVRINKKDNSQGEWSPSDLTGALIPYAGIFLPEDSGAPWTAALRERLRSRFVRAASEARRELEQASQHEDAATLYQRGLDADNLAEAFYQGLMRSHAATGRTADATATYQKLKQRLSISFGLKPLGTTERLYQTLRRG